MRQILLYALSNLFDSINWIKLIWPCISSLKATIHCEIFFRAFHAIQFQCHFMKHEILSWNSFTLVFKLHFVRFSSIKKLCLQGKDILYNLIVLNSVTHKVKTNKQQQQQQQQIKRPKLIWMKPCLQIRNDKSASANVFLELPLTN